jgi:phosphomethylpyrimidine synthase
MTQLQSAREGVITDAMRIAARDELIDPETLLQLIAEGAVVLPYNVNRPRHPVAIGKGLCTKVNANIGTSEEHCRPDEELEKLQVAVEAGAHSVMDLSTGGDLDRIRVHMLEASPVMVGTVPIYSVAARLAAEEREIVDMTADDLFAEIERQALQGVDFITVHCGINRRSIHHQTTDERVLGVVSRGGSLLKRWMLHHDRENPLYEQFDRLLEICAQHDVTLSLGDGFRPGSQADATDRAQIAELLELGELVDRSRNRGVQVMVEGPGHVPLPEVAGNVLIAKKITRGAPFYVLGPLVTDFASGYDHLAGAIGGAIAAAQGADFLCVVTPAEHLCLPNADDIRQGVIASRIAGHVGDMVRGVPGAIETDREISRARREFDWETIFGLSVDPKLARRRKEESESSGKDHCTMCGSLCAVKTDRKSAGK